MTRTITCRDCGHPYETSRSNTVVCGLCRLISDLSFINERTAKCWMCDTVFAPLNRGDTLCGGCTYHPKRHGAAQCSYCHGDKLKVIAEITVCHDCARDPSRRRPLRKSLAIKQRERKQQEAAA